MTTLSIRVTVLEVPWWLDPRNTTEISPYTRTHKRDLLWGAKATLEWEQKRETGTEEYRNRETEQKERQNRLQCCNGGDHSTHT